MEKGCNIRYTSCHVPWLPRDSGHHYPSSGASHSLPAQLSTSRYSRNIWRPSLGLGSSIINSRPCGAPFHIIGYFGTTVVTSGWFPSCFSLLPHVLIVFCHMHLLSFTLNMFQMKHVFSIYTLTSSVCTSFWISALFPPPLLPSIRSSEIGLRVLRGCNL